MVKVYRALFSYTSQQTDELTFEEGDRIYVKDQSETGWWRATVKGKSGLVPSNYVAEDLADTIDFPLHEASKRGNLSFLNECLNNKIPINAQDKAGNTPLHWAALGGHAECITALLSTNLVHLNTQNRLGDTSLHGAAWKGYDNIVKMLLEKGFDSTIKNKDGKTALAISNDAATQAMLKPRSNSQVNTSNDDYLDESD